MNLLLLNEIKEGSTKGHAFWIKHPGIGEEANLDLLNSKFLALAVKRKIPLEEQAIVLAEKRGTWTPANERDLNSSLAYSERLLESYNKSIEAQKKYIIGDLDEIILKVKNLKEKKFAAIGNTAEAWASKLSNERYILNLFYKDSSCLIKAWSDEEVEFLEQFEVDVIMMEFLNYRKRFADENLKELACSGFCQNLYSIAPNSFYFFGKPVVALTGLQQRLILFLENYKNIISSMAGKIPDSVLCDWKELDKWAKSAERGREELEKGWSGNKGSDGINYESIRKASMTENHDAEIKSMQNLLG